MHAKTEAAFFKEEEESIPIVHVLIPVFNAEKFIIQAVRSIEMQDYKNIELIIFDDASTDRSIPFIKEAGLKKPIHLFESKLNQGISAARKSLLEHSKKLNPQAYIFWLDADDCYTTKEAISSVMMKMLTTKADICLFNFSITFEDEGQIANAKGLLTDKENNEKLLQEVSENPSQIISARDFNVLQFSSLGWTKCYAPTITLAEPAACPFEDFVYMSALLKAKRITTMPPCLEIINYLRRSTSICGKRIPENFIDHIPRQLERLLDIVIADTNDDDDRAIKLIYVREFIFNKLIQYRKTLETTIQSKVDGFSQDMLEKYDHISMQIMGKVNKAVTPIEEDQRLLP